MWENLQFLPFDSSYLEKPAETNTNTEFTWNSVRNCIRDRQCFGEVSSEYYAPNLTSLNNNEWSEFKNNRNSFYETHRKIAANKIATACGSLVGENAITETDAKVDATK